MPVIPRVPIHKFFIITEAVGRADWNIFLAKRISEYEGTILEQLVPSFRRINAEGGIAQWQSIRLQIERSPVQLWLPPAFNRVRNYLIALPFKIV